MSQGILQHDTWGVKGDLDWSKIRADIQEHGINNSMLTCCMPTGSTSQILGQYENFEPLTSNIYNRKVLSGEYPVINRYLMDELIRMNIWSTSLKNKIIMDGGSIQAITEIPIELRELHKTNWDLKQKSILDLSIGRGPFIDQTQSLNIYMSQPELDRLSKMHFYGWKGGLKTGMYYLRTKPQVTAKRITCTEDVCIVCQ
jgi:ribonucleoside-diphosphate reductase alpha chain